MRTPTPQPGPVHAGEADRWGGWHWRDPDRGEHFRRCSYCGSMHPEDLVNTPGCRVDWADQKYGWPHKFYVHVPNLDPDRLYVIGSSNHPTNGWPQYHDLPREQRKIVRREAGYPKDVKSGYYQLGTRSHHFGKVYTQHLADPNLSAEVRQQVGLMCGLVFEFLPDGRIAWKAPEVGG